MTAEAKITEILSQHGVVPVASLVNELSVLVYQSGAQRGEVECLHDELDKMKRRFRDLTKKPKTKRRG